MHIFLLVAGGFHYGVNSVETSNQIISGEYSAMDRLLLKLGTLVRGLFFMLESDWPVVIKLNETCAWLCQDIDFKGEGGAEGGNGFESLSFIGLGTIAPNK